MNNQDRMDYDRYRAVGWPTRQWLGSGGQYKFLVARRFRGDGMRWRPHNS